MSDPSATYPSLRNRVVFITGGGSGIGASLTQAFARQGAKVAFVDIALEESQALVESIATTGNAPLFLPCDIRDISALRKAVDEIRAKLGPIEILVNNAA